MTDPRSITKPFVVSSANSFLNDNYPNKELPIPIEDIVEINLGIRLILMQNLVKDFGVNAFINTKFDSIVVDEYIFSKQPERTRFTIAEEIGHLVLHKEWYSVNGPKSFDTYFDWQESLDQQLFEYIERQAKTFAGLVLAPSDLLRKDFSNICGEMEPPVDLFQLPDTTFPQLTQMYRISPDCLLIRLHQGKLISIPDGFKLKR